MADLVSPELEAKLNANATEPMRSTRRQRSLAVIQAAIASAKAPPDEVSEQADTEAAGGLISPEIAPPPSAATKEQKEEAKARIEADRELSKRQEDILKAQEKLLGKEEADRLRKEQEAEAAKSAALKAGEKAIKTSGKIVHGADVRIGSIPQPGSIVFPLVVLLLLFFLIVPVNGQTRLGWLWAVLTGNAYVGDPVRPAQTETPENQPQETGQGGSQTPFVPLVKVPANGVYTPVGGYL